jgi:hypothetical protein
MPPLYTMATPEERDAAVKTIPGNAPESSKAYLVSMMARICGYEPGFTDGFGLDIARRLKLTEVSLSPKVDEPSRQEFRTVFETIVEAGASSCLLIRVRYADNLCQI